MEGKYYVWSLAEVNGILGRERAKTFCLRLRRHRSGNWEEHNILNLPQTIAQAAKLLGRDEEELRAELGQDRARAARRARPPIPPGKDTKVLTSWNGLMIAALAEGGADPRGRALPRRRRAGPPAFLLDRMRTRRRPAAPHLQGRPGPKFNAYLDDYANLIDGLTRLYEATGEPRWIESALDLARVMIDEFADPEHGGFFYTGKSHEALIARQKDCLRQRHALGQRDGRHRPGPARRP